MRFKQLANHQDLRVLPILFSVVVVFVLIFAEELIFVVLSSFDMHDMLSDLVELIRGIKC